MKKENVIKLFEDKKIRVEWVDDEEKWFFSVVDVIEVLTGSKRARKYWSDLKKKLNDEGSQLSEKIGQLKLLSPDGKRYKSDVANTEQLFRLIQSIPSPKAEPFKLWLAKVGYERVEEIEDPELAIERALETYLKKENLRDNMRNLELVLNMLAEVTTTEISKEKKPESFDENREIAKAGGTIAGNTRKEIEKKTGKSVISKENAKSLMISKKREIEE